MEQRLSIALVNASAKVIATVLVGCFAVAITALANTVIGKFILIGISGWIAVNIFGLEINNVKEFVEVVRNDPSYLVEAGLDVFL